MDQAVPGRFGVTRAAAIAADAAMFAAAVILCIVLVKNYLLPPSAAPRSVGARSADSVKVGTDLRKRIDGIDWTRNGQTLVLVLSTHCHFCTESAPFFKHLQKTTAGRVKLVAVLPEPVHEATLYLDGEGVRLDQVKQASLYKVGVEGTPTMLLVNRDGIVTQE